MGDGRAEVAYFVTRHATDLVRLPMRVDRTRSMHDTGAPEHVVGVIVIGTFCVYRWHAEPERQRRIRGVDPGIIERVGPGLASWLARTRSLIAILELFREHTLVMLEHERERQAGLRGLGRQISDTNYYLEIRKAREAAAMWLEERETLDEPQQRIVRELEIDTESLTESLAFPWGVTYEHDRKLDRTDELKPILEATEHALAQLAIIDQRISSFGPSPYR